MFQAADIPLSKESSLASRRDTIHSKFPSLAYASAHGPNTISRRIDPVSRLVITESVTEMTSCAGRNFSPKERQIASLHIRLVQFRSVCLPTRAPIIRTISRALMTSTCSISSSTTGAGSRWMEISHQCHERRLVCARRQHQGLSSWRVGRV